MENYEVIHNLKILKSTIIKKGIHINLYPRFAADMVKFKNQDLTAILSEEFVIYLSSLLRSLSFLNILQFYKNSNSQVQKQSVLIFPY